MEALGENHRREDLYTDYAKTLATFTRCMLRYFEAEWEKTLKISLQQSFQVHDERSCPCQGDIPFFLLYVSIDFGSFYGKAHVTYLPSREDKVTGLSKLARAVEVAAKIIHNCRAQS